MHPAKPSAVRGGSLSNNKRVYIKNNDVLTVYIPANTPSKLLAGLHELQFIITHGIEKLYAMKVDPPSPIWNAADLGMSKQHDEGGWYLDGWEDGAS